MSHFYDNYYDLVQLWTSFLVQEIDPIIDPQLLADDAIAWELRHGGDLRAELSDLERLVADVDGDEETAKRLCDSLIDRVGRPDGPSLVEWLRVQLEVMREAVDGKALMPDFLPENSHDGLRLRRASRFTDEAAANRAVTEVLRAHEDRFRGWAADPGGWPRQHYYADLGREVGRMAVAKGQPTVAATAAVVVMALDPQSGQPVVRTSYPELGLDAAAREAFPDLCHWFGGWFNQDFAHPWDSIVDVNQTVRDPARSRVREQLTQVLTIEDDQQLIATIEACGSYMLPTRMRWWLKRTLWRLDAYDWLGTRTG